MYVCTSTWRRPICRGSIKLVREVSPRKVFFLLETLNGPKVPEDSSDFDDFWTELIVTTRSIVWDTLGFFRFFSRGRSARWFFFRVGGEQMSKWIQIQRKSKRKRKQKRKRGNLRGGRLRAPAGCFTRCVCVFVFRFYLRWIWVLKRKVERKEHANGHSPVACWSEKTRYQTDSWLFFVFISFVSSQSL